MSAVERVEGKRQRYLKRRERKSEARSQVTPGLRQPIRLGVDFCAVALKSGNGSSSLSRIPRAHARRIRASAKFCFEIPPPMSALLPVFAIEHRELIKRTKNASGKKYKTEKWTLNRIDATSSILQGSRPSSFDPTGLMATINSADIKSDNRTRLLLQAGKGAPYEHANMD